MLHQILKKKSKSVQNKGPSTNVVLCTIWYHVHNLKNVKNTHGGVLILVKLQAKPATLLKVTLLHGCFLRFLNCMNGTKSHKAPQIRVSDRVPLIFFSPWQKFELVLEIYRCTVTQILLWGNDVMLSEVIFA